MATMRVVRTPAGAKFFGKPIGSVITEGEVFRAQARAKNLNLPATPPKGALTDAIHDRPDVKGNPDAITITAVHKDKNTGKTIKSEFTVIGENQAKAVRAALEAVGAEVTVKGANLDQSTAEHKKHSTSKNRS